MDLTFSEAARGINKEVSVSMEDACDRCKGNRAEPGSKIVRCHHCNGTGQVSSNPKLVLKAVDTIGNYSK